MVTTTEAVSAVVAAVPPAPMRAVVQGSLRLNRRQRAMLAEMGVRMWLPPSALVVQSGTRPADADTTSAEATSVQRDAATLHPEMRHASASAGAQELAVRAQHARSARHIAHPSAVPLSTAQTTVTRSPAQDAASAVHTGAPQHISSPVPVDTHHMAPARVELEQDTDLMQAAQTCQQCALGQSRRHSIWQADATTWIAPRHEGMPAAPQADWPRWLIVLDPPGQDENQQKQAAQGDAGRLLQNMVRAVGLRPQQVYCTHITKCALPVGRSVQLAELTACARFVQEEIVRVQPTVVLALGRSAAYGLLQRTEPLGQLRGQIHRLVLDATAQHAQGDSAVTSVPLVVSYPLGYLLRDASAKARAWQDLGLALLACQQAVAQKSH